MWWNHKSNVLDENLISTEQPSQFTAYHKYSVGLNMELDMQKIEQWKNGLERDGFLVIGKHIKHIL